MIKKKLTVKKQYYTTVNIYKLDITYKRFGTKN